MADDPRTIFVAESMKVADAVLKLLSEGGIGAEVVAPPPQSVSDPLTGTTEMVTTDAMEIRVTDPKQVEAANELLTKAVNATLINQVREKRAARTGTVTAVCEDCGQSSEWDASQMGTTETCPHCAGYMDIPDPEDDWDGVDFGEDEDAEDAEDADEEKGTEK